jgi:cytochrome c biogenesis protein CcmG, thiol:disulfide interchange protein DsbE
LQARPRPGSVTVVAALVLSFILAACGTSGSGTAKVGEQAPGITATTLDGRSVSLGSLRGRPVIVNFWASWCGPCRDEFPLLKDELARHAADGLAVVGVVYKDDPDPARAFAMSFGSTWPSVIDPDGAIAKAYRMVAPPQSYFIDRAGVLRSIQIGILVASDFDRQYQAIAQ